jgi:hypothetical protein
MRTAFVVLTYNRPDAALAVLRAWRRNAGRITWWSWRTTARGRSRCRRCATGLPRFACPVHHVWHPDVGFTAARARNLGASPGPRGQAITSSSWTATCVPTPHFVAAHAALAEPGHFVNGSRVLLSDALTRRALAGRNRAAAARRRRVAAAACGRAR